MKMSKLFAPTLREDPAEAEVISHKLMLRAGMIRKLAAGVYTFLPLGWRVIGKIMKIVREEMDRAGAQEVHLPALNPAELWIESGRWDVYGDELMRIKDRHKRDFCLGPTHEEVITDLVRNEVKSYKELPLNLYQIQTKFRDEIRPRFGLMRGREFLMKDAYSFHSSEADLEREYKNMEAAYRRIFDRIGLKYKVVEADPGAIGGGFSQEFMVLAPTGEDAIYHCNVCEYAASHEVAKIGNRKVKGERGKVEIPPVQKVKTPNVKTIEDLEAFLKAKPEQMIKTLIHVAGLEIYAVLVRGDHKLDEAKLKHLANNDDIKLADEDLIRKVTGAPVGFAGPVGLKGVKIIADLDIPAIEDGITGANEADTHIVHVKYGRDFEADIIGEIRYAAPGDPCPKCPEGRFAVTRGIEVGHIFKLGTKYSEKMKATFLDEKNNEVPYIMGCYGIGIGRAGAAAIEQSNDKDGIIWPTSIAPYQVIIVPVNVLEKEQKEVSEKLYKEMLDAGIEVVLDDREERIGMKLKDVDLMGFPVKVIIGPRSLKEGNVEIKLRKDGETVLVKISEVTKKVKEMLK
ncbi:MAG: proline--tRNA ligase [Candidatus Saganbacteria bacterium]|nr:proline--tRNA ligase [Candidatus Saganbacteria bacterium]